MAPKEASDVAKRCLCLELLLQRLGLEIDDQDPVKERDAVRRAWISRLGQLGLEDAMLADERELLERGLSALTEDECDDIEGRVIGGLALLWALGRLPEPPTARTLGEATSLIAEHGILGDGSISGAKAAVASARLRPEGELREALAAYEQTRAAQAVEGSESEQMVATIAHGSLSWILDPAMTYGAPPAPPAQGD